MLFWQYLVVTIGMLPVVLNAQRTLGQQDVGVIAIGTRRNAHAMKEVSLGDATRGTRL